MSDSASLASNGPRPHSDAETQPDRLPRWMPHYAVIAGIASISTIGVSYLLQSAYLAAFGLQPEQIGLNQFTAVTRLLPAAMASLVLIIGVLALGGWIASVLRQTGFGIPLAVGLCVLCLIGALALGRSTDMRLDWAAGHASLVAFMGIVAVLVYAATKSWGGRSVASLLAALLLAGTLVAVAYDAVSGAASERGRTYLVQHDNIGLEIIGPAPHLPNGLKHCA
jgi:hypothetical protein